MNIITQRLIEIGTKIRKEISALRTDIRVGVANLDNGVKNLKDAVDAQRKSYEECRETNPPIAITDLRTNIPIRVETKPKRGKIESAGRFIKGTLEIAGIIAVIVYTGVSYRTWQASADAADYASRQAELSRKSLNETIKNFRLGQRPIVSLTNDLGTPQYFPPPSNQIVWEWHFTNYGKTPAIELKTGTEYMKIGQTGKWIPSYHAKDTKLNRSTHPLPPETPERATVVSDPGITQSQFNQLLTESYSISIRGTLYYTDVYREKYETGFCITRLNGGGITWCEGNYIK